MTGEDRLHPGLLHHVVNTLSWPGLRPLQAEAVTPLVDGHDALLLAPTAGGKTEAAVFPLLTAMTEQRWTGLSVLYVTPLRALLNNLEPRLSTYTGWLGRRAALWHGDTTAGARQRLLREPPDILLTTPESLEAILVSTRVDPVEFLGNVRAVVVDEVHAFAGDDRGWHLLAVLERISRLAGRPLQRVGLSATVGNPAELLAWLQGPMPRPGGLVIAPVDAAGPAAAEITLDHVGSVGNAARVIASLHAGEKRLAFCESRRAAEELAERLQGLAVTTFVSHSSLSRDERRRAEEAFSVARDCVIVATSTLELGVDVGDLDRVIQVDAPGTVASFLQRLGRTGRRPGSVRNMLFLATDERALVRAAAVLLLWSDGWVEPIVPPPSPRHLTAQQLLGRCLQEGTIGRRAWKETAFPAADDAGVIASWLEETGHLSSDGELLQIGVEAERRYGRRHFLELVSVFTTAPEFVVMAGRVEVGSVDPGLLTRRSVGPRVFTLGGRPWRVTHVDWVRRRCWVEAAEEGARTTWTSSGRTTSFAVVRASRRVLAGETPPVVLTRRAVDALAAARTTAEGVAPSGTTVERRDRELVWWTWAGARANATLAASLPSVVAPAVRWDDRRLVLLEHVDRVSLAAATQAAAAVPLVAPEVDDAAVRGLKFAELLPPGLAAETLGERMLDSAALSVLGEPVRWSAQ